MTATVVLAHEPRAARRLALPALGAAAVSALSPLHVGVPCAFRALTGHPCPFCGMTRSVVAAFHGNAVASLRFQPFGIVLVALAVWLVLRRPRAIVMPAWAIPVAIALSWAWNLTLNPTFH